MQVPLRGCGAHPGLPCGQPHSIQADDQPCSRNSSSTSSYSSSDARPCPAVRDLTSLTRLPVRPAVLCTGPDDDAAELPSRYGSLLGMSSTPFTHGLVASDSASSSVALLANKVMSSCVSLLARSSAYV